MLSKDFKIVWSNFYSEVQSILNSWQICLQTLTFSHVKCLVWNDCCLDAKTCFSVLFYVYLFCTLTHGWELMRTLYIQKKYGVGQSHNKFSFKNSHYCWIKSKISTIESIFTLCTTMFCTIKLLCIHYHSWRLKIVFTQL